MRIPPPRRLPLLGAALLTLSLATAAPAAADEPPATTEELQARIDHSSLDARARGDAAEELAEKHHRPELLVPWLRERLGKEQDFHVRLALAYALAAQGEVEGLRTLVDSLEVLGHLGYVYLTRVSEQDFGGPGVGWNKPAWDAWLAALDAAAWRELQRKRHLPRVPLDADAAGFAKAVAWWDALGYPDVGTLPFVRLVAGWMEVGDERRDQWTYGFLVREDETSFTVFETDLTQSTHLREPPPGSWKVRLEPADIQADVRRELDAHEGRGTGDTWAENRDAFGVDYLQPTRRIQGLVLARALAARGHQDLALAVWKHVAERPGLAGFVLHGPWSNLEFTKADARDAALLAWEAEIREPARTWAEALASYRIYRKRFDAEGRGAALEATLVRMAEQEPRYAAAARSEAADPTQRARDLVLALPTVARACSHSGTPADLDGAHRGSRLRPDDEGPPDALDGLLALGYPAVPELRAALGDRRLTKSEAHYFGYSKGWMRHDPDAVSVAALALFALKEIAQRDFVEGHLHDEEGWTRVGRQVDAWWALFQQQGERAALEQGVRLRDAKSPTQAQRLVAGYPETALAAVREAAQGAEPRIDAGLLAALTPLARPDVQDYLLARAREGPLLARLAAAEALHAQGRPEGLDRLLSEWPALSAPGEDERFGYRSGWDLERLVALCFRLDPGKAVARFRATLDQVGTHAKFQLLGRVHMALGHDEHSRLPDAPPHPRPPEVLEAAEALVVALVLDQGEREGQHFTAAGQETNRVGERAAATAALLWPARYRFDEQAPARERLLQRHAIVNAWRERTGKAALAPPPLPQVPALPPETTRPLVEAWLATKAGEAARTAAADALLAAGLGALPALKAARDGLAQDDPRRPALDGLVRRMAVIAREVLWAPGSLPAPPAFAALVDEVRGQPVRGAWITGLWRALARGVAGEATSLDLTLTRLGDDTGAVVVLSLSTATTPWEGTRDGWVLTASGWEHVEDAFLRAQSSWWHDARGPQLDEELLVPEGQEIRLRRTLTRVR